MRSVQRCALSVPALYIPYIKVPTGQKRQSGFLPPDITNDSRDGATTELQYYFNLHPQRDATAGARVMSNRARYGWES